MGLFIFFYFFISLGRVVVLFPKIAINLPRTYEKLSCKGEPFHYFILRRYILISHITITHKYTKHNSFNLGFASFQSVQEKRNKDVIKSPLEYEDGKVIDDLTCFRIRQ